jgi:hypothetical protein
MTPKDMLLFTDVKPTQALPRIRDALRDLMKISEA